MSTDAFEKFFFDVCTLDYARMQPGMKMLKAEMEATNLAAYVVPRVHNEGELRSETCDELSEDSVKPARIADDNWRV